MSHSVSSNTQQQVAELGDQRRKKTVPDTKKQTLSEEEASIYIGISRSSLRQGRMNGQRNHRMSTPPYVKVGRKILYLIQDLDRWLVDHRTCNQESV